MNDNRKVVVLVSIKTSTRTDGKMFAAHLPELGLTAYGRTEEDAKCAVRALFASFIDQYRSLGLLEKRLNQIGAKWYWEDEYPNDGIPIEYVTDANAVASTVAPSRPATHPNVAYVSTSDLRLAA